MVESTIPFSIPEKTLNKTMVEEREEELLGLITRFNSARRKGAYDVATSLASELFPALCNRLKTFTRNLFRDFNDSDLEDVVQDVMMDLIKDNYAKLAKTKSISYLYSICNSRGRDFQRRKSKVYELDSIGDGEYQAEIPSPEGRNPDEMQFAAQRDATIERICDTYIPKAVKSLPQPYRQIASLIFIDFAYQDGKISNEALFEMIHHHPPMAEDSAEMDNLRQRKSRARRKLVDELRESMKDDPEAWAIITEFESGCHK
jgi:DNA-directed RNA polymerase specialized sigma24 family protein